MSQGYEILYNHREFAKEFTKILTHDELLLDTLPNAQLFSCCANAQCYIEKDDPLVWSDDKYLMKTKNVSMIISGKQFTPLHIVRNTLAQKLYYRGGVDLFGAFVKRAIKFKSQALDSYYFHIALENEQSSYYYTEKVIDCFLSMTMPIYLGATKISQFFNKDGIIEVSVNDLDNIDEILKHCTKEFYESRLEAIKDNYNRALRYVNRNNRIYEDLFIH